jgi:hypothetical protein
MSIELTSENSNVAKTTIQVSGVLPLFTFIKKK